MVVWPGPMMEPRLPYDCCSNASIGESRCNPLPSSAIEFSKCAICSFQSSRNGRPVRFPNGRPMSLLCQWDVAVCGNPAGGDCLVPAMRVGLRPLSGTVLTLLMWVLLFERGSGSGAGERRSFQTRRARWRLRQRSASLRDLPSACLRAR